MMLWVVRYCDSVAAVCCAVLTWAMVLRACYAMCGTEKEPGWYRAGVWPYATSSTELAYGPTSRLRRKLLEREGECGEMGGRLEVGCYGPHTRCPVLTYRMVVRGVRHRDRVWWYARKGTGIAYDAMRVLGTRGDTRGRVLRLATRCPLAYAPTPYWAGVRRYALCSTKVPYSAMGCA
eukprot:999132-Rhodomonas_salina.1